MQPREKILAAAVAGLVALLAMRWVYNSYSDAVSARQGRIERLSSEIATKKARVAAAERTATDLAELEERSLPADPDLARTLYQNWLLEQVVAAKLQEATVSSSRGFARGEAYQLLPFTVRAKGGLDDLTRLLYAFYSAPHLHQVRRLGIKPIDGSDDLDFSLSVEALSLPRANREDTLSDAPADRLAPNKAEFYRVIAARDLFSPYQPPPPPQPTQPAPGPPPRVVNTFNDAEFAVVTALIQVGPDPQAWINVRTTGKLLKLRVGDEVRVGQFSGRLSRISPRAVEFDSDQRRIRVALGESLTQGAPLPVSQAPLPQGP